MALLSIFSIFIFDQTMHSDASIVLTPEPAANAGGLWHVQDGNKVYVNMRYAADETAIETGSIASVYSGFDYSTFTSWKPLIDYSDGTYTDDNFSFPNTSNVKSATIDNPDPTTFDKFTVEIVANMMPFDRYGVDDIEQPSYKLIRQYDSAVSTVRVDLHDWSSIQDIAYMTLKVDGQEILSSENIEENSNFMDIAFGVRMYWSTSETNDTSEPIDPGTVDAWDQLPETSGSPQTPLENWGVVSNLVVNNQTVSFDVDYNGTKYPVEPFTVDGNLDFMGKSHDVLYYTDPDTGDRVLYFNFGETLSTATLAARSFTDVSEWKGEALWNLSQNEIKVTDLLKVYNYIDEIDNDGNVYSYFYMPDVPLDSLISVSSILAYRYWSDGFLGLGQPEAGDIQYKNVAAVRGETSSVNPTWVEQTYTTAFIAGGITTFAALSPLSVVPGVGWAIPVASFLVGGTLLAADINEFFAYDVEQIQHVFPDVALANEINSYITQYSADDTITVDTDKLYKLHLATLQDHEDVEILESLSNVTQVVWETDGEIFVVNDPSIEDIEWGGPGTEVPVDDPGNADLEMILYIIGGGILLYVVLTFDWKKNKVLLIILGAGAVYILYQMGLI